MVENPLKWSMFWRACNKQNTWEVECVRAAVNKDWWLTVQELQADPEIPKTTVPEILTQDRGMKHVMAKFTLWLLLSEQKEQCAAVANDLIQTTTNEPDFLKKVITRNESWVYSYDPEMKAQSSQWKLPDSLCPDKTWQSRSQINTMLTVFFDWEVVVHHNYASPGQTINKKYYLNVFCQLRDAIRWKRTQLWATSDWQLHHNNVPTHALHLVQSFFVKHQIILVTQPPYSPDLVPCDFWLFPKLKSPLKGKRFPSLSVSKIQENTTGQLMAIPQQRILQRVLNSGRDTGRTAWGPKVPILKKTEVALSYVQCFSYFVSSSVSVSIFHITWLDTFWTDHIYTYICYK